MLKRNKNAKNQNRYVNKRAQSAVEYMLLFATVMVVVMYSFDSFLPFIRDSSNLYYNGVIIGITGKAAPDFCHVNFGGATGCMGY